jgi:hypothetical protein
VTKEQPPESNKEGDAFSGGREGEGGLYISTSFSSLPKGLFDDLSQIAKDRGMFPRDLFSDAVAFMLSERGKGQKLPYIVPRKGGEKKTIWLSKEACMSIQKVSKNDNVSKNVVFLTALKLYCEREGLHVGL